MSSSSSSSSSSKDAVEETRYLLLLVRLPIGDEIIQYKIDMKHVVSIEYLAKQALKSYSGRDNHAMSGVGFEDCFESLLTSVFGEDYDDNGAGDAYDPFMNNKEEKVDYTFLIRLVDHVEPLFSHC